MVGIIRAPGGEQKMDVLAEAARHDVCLASCNSNPAGSTGRVRDPLHPVTRWVHPTHVPGRGRVPFLKVLQTNVCRNRCAYCHLAVTQDSVRRLSFAPAELAGLFLRMAGRRLVEGLFLSSALGLRPEAAMEDMVQTARILRRSGYEGYIHLKILPGASRELIEQAACLADRISINLEAPTQARLRAIAPDKDLQGDLLPRMRWAAEILGRGARARSQTTQFVVGAAGESDREILRAADWVCRRLGVHRAYYSAFQPGDPPEGAAPLPAGLGGEGGRSATPLLRERRLYQGDALLRFYGFRPEELPFDAAGQLPPDEDPKSAFARAHPELFPLDVNRAEEALLLRVPGIGPLSARRIVAARRRAPFRRLEELRATGTATGRAAPYIELSGKRAAAGPSAAGRPGGSQLELFG